MYTALALEALACTFVLFLAHDLFLNEKVIEPAMARGKSWSYPAGFAYYFAFIFGTLTIFHFVRRQCSAHA